MTRLVMSDILPVPKLSVRPGAVVDVISRYGMGQMSLPTPLAHHSASLCEITHHHQRTGATSVTYRLLTPGVVTFVSSYVHPTPLADPALSAKVTVTS